MQDGQRSKLSLHSSGNDKSNEKINIFVKKFKNLVTQKPEGLTLYAKIDFNENQIAESQKIQVTPDHVPDLNFNATLTVLTTDQNSLDDIAYKPIIITLIEVLPKEKKQKEEKVQTFGQATFDLLDLIKGHTDLSLKLTVHPTPGSTLETQPAELPLPELEVKVMLDQAIVSEEESSKCNLLTINLDSMYAIPETWINNNREYAFTASLPLPVSDEKDNAVVFVNGMLKAPTDPISKQKRWVDTRGIQAANAIFLSQQAVVEDSNNTEELGDFQSKEDKEFKTTAEKEKHRIVWSSERRCFLNQTSNNALREQVLKSRYWPIEILRSSIPTGVKGKRDEDLNMSYHGVVYIDMQPLLYPGATQIRGAYKIHPFNDNEYTNKTRRKIGIADEALKVVNYLYDRNFAVSPVKKDQKAPEKKDNKKARESNADGHDISQSVQQIIESRSFIIIDIKFDKPLIPRKPFEYLVKRVSELIPPRPKYPLKTNSAEKAVNDYHSQIKTILNTILEDYRILNLDQNDSSLDNSERSLTDFETKRKKLLFELNSTGKYFAFKEQLKNSVVKIVREKFLRTSALNDPEELQQFLSELYVFLIDELHKSLNETLAVEDAPTVDNSLTDSLQMKHFAQEAEMNRNYDLAAYYYQERIAREKDNYFNWYDYAVFNLLIEDYSRSEECLKECISINPNELNGLLLYSVICTMQEKFDVAETFLERVTAQDNDHVVGWTLYSILYEQKGQDLNSDITIKKVTKINQSQFNELQTNLQHQNLIPQVTIEPDEDTSSAKKDDDILDESKLPPEAKSRNSKRGTITNPTKIKLDSSGKSKSPTNKNDEAGPSLKDKQSIIELAIRKSIYMRTASFLIKNNAFAWAEKCMAKELVSPSGGPSCQYHILLAKIKLAKNELEEAEKHCCEALSYDYQNYEAWILWSHVRYLGGDFRGAKERYERVLQFPELPSDQTHSIYIRLASIYLKEENYEDSKKLFLYPCKNSPSCMSWLGVGICCYRLGQLEEAKNALSEANILNNKAPEVWAYLSLICLKTSKPLEAEQAYKYAIKLNLDNPELLDEIHSLQESLGFGNPEF